MPFGQSIGARIGTKAIMAGLGFDPISQAIASRVVGWTVATLTMDHHSQAIAEVADHAHDAYNIGEQLSDAHDYDHHYDYNHDYDHQRSGNYGDTWDHLTPRFETHDQVAFKESGYYTTFTANTNGGTGPSHYVSNSLNQGVVTGKFLDKNDNRYYTVVVDNKFTISVYENQLLKA